MKPYRTYAPVFDRLERFSTLLELQDCDAAVVSGRGNVRFFSDFRLNRVASALLVVPRLGETVFFVAGLDWQRAKRECPLLNIQAYPEDTPNPLEALRTVLHSPSIRRVGIESSLPYGHWQFIRDLLPATDFVLLDEQLLRLRAIKDPVEICRLRQAARIADLAMQKVLAAAVPGKTELELVGLSRMTLAEEGAEDESFESFMMSGERSWLPGRVATTKKIQEQELIVFDMGAVVGGYCSDITRTFALGGLRAEQRYIFQIAYAAQQSALEAVKPGVQAQVVHAAARKIIVDAGYGDFFPHLTGHGLGLEIHELPILDRQMTILLEPNMVLTIEPGIYLPGVGAARVEDMVLVTAGGCELLTKTPRELV
ncbi:MAG: Xaa-Pro peptidase family protein [bacterium]